MAEAGICNGRWGELCKGERGSYFLFICKGGSSEAINPKKKRRKEGERNSWNNLANGSSLLDGKDVSEWLLHIV